MSDPRDQAIRELAEEIANACRDSGIDSFDRQYEDPDEWEARLRAALPTVSSLLGELAMAWGVIHELDRRADLYREGKDGDSDWKKDRNGGLSAASRDAANLIRSVLAPGSGRLAEEVLRAAVRNALAERAGEEMEPRTPEEYAKDDELWENVAESRKAFFAAVDALRAAHPELAEAAGGVVRNGGYLAPEPEALRNLEAKWERWEEASHGQAGKRRAPTQRAPRAHRQSQTHPGGRIGPARR